MGFTTVKCPSCGASIDLDGSREFGFCTCCGTKVIQDKIVVEHRGTIKIDGTVTMESLLERAQIMLRDGDFANADTYFDRVLDIEPRNASAYFGRELCTIHVRGEAGLANYNRSILDDSLFKKALDYSSGDEHKRYEDLGNLTLVNQNEIQQNQEEIQQRKLDEAKAQLDILRLANNKARKRIFRVYAIVAILGFVMFFFIVRGNGLVDSKTGEIIEATTAIAFGYGFLGSISWSLIASLFLIKDFKTIHRYQTRKEKYLAPTSRRKW